MTSTGGPYVADPELADLFALMLESNEARRAVEWGDDLREVILRPVDTDAINAEIQRLRNRKEKLDTLEDKRARLPDFESEMRRLEENLEATRVELAELESEIKAADVELKESRRKESAFQDALDDLRNLGRPGRHPLPGRDRTRDPSRTPRSTPESTMTPTIADRSSNRSSSPNVTDLMTRFKRGRGSADSPKPSSKPS